MLSHTSCATKRMSTCTRRQCKLSHKCWCTSMTAVPGMNMRLLGLGVCCVWMNMPRRCSAALKPVESNVRLGVSPRFSTVSQTQPATGARAWPATGPGGGGRVPYSHLFAAVPAVDTLQLSESLAQGCFRRPMDRESPAQERHLRVIAII